MKKWRFYPQTPNMFGIHLESIPSLFSDYFLSKISKGFVSRESKHLTVNFNWLKWTQPWLISYRLIEHSFFYWLNDVRDFIAHQISIRQDLSAQPNHVQYLIDIVFIAKKKFLRKKQMFMFHSITSVSNVAWEATNDNSYNVSICQPLLKVNIFEYNRQHRSISGLV